VPSGGPAGGLRTPVETPRRTGYNAVRAVPLTVSAAGNAGTVKEFIHKQPVNNCMTALLLNNSPPL
jgi:hypothetical protein